MRWRRRYGRSAAAAAVAAVAVSVALGFGSGRPSRAQLRDTVERYLTASTPTARCALFTDSYRSMNVAVLLAGGCERSEQRSAAQEADLRALKIAGTQVHGGDATVLLRPAPGSRVRNGQLTLLELDLLIEHGRWRIDGWSATSHGRAHA